MAQAFTRSLYIWGLILCSFSGISQDAVLSGQRTAVVTSYRSQISVREKTGHNDGTQVEAYLRTVGLGAGYAWCAAFVKWNLIQGKVAAASQITGAAASCYQPSRVILFAHRWKSDILPGDVFTLWFNSLKRIGHTGFVDSWANKSAGTIITYEGNSNAGGSRDGDGVYRRIRQAGSIYAICRWID